MTRGFIFSLPIIFQRQFFQFNPGEYTAGTTSPLYVIVLRTQFHYETFYIFNSIFFLLFHFSAVYLFTESRSLYLKTTDLFRNLNNDIYNPETLSFLAAVLTVLNGRFAWSALSGMETTMFYFLHTRIYFHLKNLKTTKLIFIRHCSLHLPLFQDLKDFFLFTLYLF